nr:hypothetical protein GCM10025732_27510 [Glycomyces mayteni]
MTAAEGSDAWRHTAYGFVHDNEHALLEEWDRERAVEVAFIADYDAQFDQAGLMVRLDAERWIKTGVEYADGALQLGAVVTDGRSDWSTAPVPEWAGLEVTMRATRLADAVAVRARATPADGEPGPWRLVRLAPSTPTPPPRPAPTAPPLARRPHRRVHLMAPHRPGPGHPLTRPWPHRSASLARVSLRRLMSDPWGTFAPGVP